MPEWSALRPPGRPLFAPSDARQRRHARRESIIAPTQRCPIFIGILLQACKLRQNSRQLWVWCAMRPALVAVNGTSSMSFWKGLFGRREPVETKAVDPFAALLGDAGALTRAGLAIRPESALRGPAFAGAVRLISESLAVSPVRLVRLTEYDSRSPVIGDRRPRRRVAGRAIGKKRRGLPHRTRPADPTRPRRCGGPEHEWGFPTHRNRRRLCWATPFVQRSNRTQARHAQCFRRASKREDFVKFKQQGLCPRPQ